MSQLVNTVEQTPGVVSLYVRDLPADLHTAIKVEAALATEPMRRFVEDALRSEVNRRRAARGEAPLPAPER